MAGANGRLITFAAEIRVLSPLFLPVRSQVGSPVGAERHVWKLGDGIWAELAISGKLSPKKPARLKQYVELLDLEEEPGGSNARQSHTRRTLIRNI